VGNAKSLQVVGARKHRVQQLRPPAHKYSELWLPSNSRYTVSTTNKIFGKREDPI
jgi:hypothetical protein